MTGDFSKQLPKDKIYNILKKYYINCDITYPQCSDAGAHPAIISAISFVNEQDTTKNWEQFAFFYDFDVYFAGYNANFDIELMNNIRLDFLGEMIIYFKNTEYPKLLKNFYIEKLNRGENLKTTTENLDKLQEELQQTEYEKKYLENLIK